VAFELMIKKAVASDKQEQEPEAGSQESEEKRIRRMRFAASYSEFRIPT
jgi:hypothetical protein